MYHGINRLQNEIRLFLSNQNYIFDKLKAVDIMIDDLYQGI